MVIEWPRLFHHFLEHLEVFRLVFDPRESSF